MKKQQQSSGLLRFAWLSVAAAIATIGLKAGAYLLTGSVGLLSDAMESGVNLVAAIVALIALKVSERPADKDHHYGHGKAEYFSAAVEGIMIFIAAVLIVYTAVQRLLHPAPLESLGLGLAISTAAALLNGAVGYILIATGTRHNSATLRADGKHLLTDVWTSAGVIAGVLLVGITHYNQLDAWIAIAVGCNILWTGYKLISESMTSLLDAALPETEQQAIKKILDGFRNENIDFHDIRSRASGRQRFVALHILVPGNWTIQQGHDLAENVENAIGDAIPFTEVQTHIEPREDKRSYEQTH